MSPAESLDAGELLTPCAASKLRIVKAPSAFFAALILLLGSDIASAQQSTGSLDFKEFGLLAIQDGGRRKPVDTFAKETLTRITGRSTYSDKNGRKWTACDCSVASCPLERREARHPILCEPPASRSCLRVPRCSGCAS